MRLIAIGDTHGQLQKLEKLLDQVQPTDSDQVVFLGDYIDRGPDSRGVIELLIGVGQTFPQTIFIRGNHEQMMLDAIAYTEREMPEGERRLHGWTRLADLEPFVWGRETERLGDLRVWLQHGNGAWATLQSYGAGGDEKELIREKDLMPWHLIPREHIEFMRSTQLYYQLDGFLFCHAGAHDHIPIERENAYQLLWSRYAPPGKEKTHVVGHTPVPGGEPYFEGGRISLDTGAGNGGPLTACDVLTRQVWQAE